MTRAEQKFLNAINGHANSFDFAHADADPPALMPELSTLPAAIKNNPAFVATVNLKFVSLYFTLAGGTYTPIAAASLNAALKSNLPFFVWGNNDYASGFKKLKGEFPINSNWTYGIPGIWGKDNFSQYAFDANVTGLLQTGDLLIPFTSPLPGAGTTTLALNIVRCPEIGYGSLLSMINSDMFLINGVRYTLPDTTKLEQYSNQIQFQDLSIFGKFDSDKLTPNDYKVPEQFQNGIVDIPISGRWGSINKHRAWGFYNLFDNINSSWTVFCQQVRKLT